VIRFFGGIEVMDMNVKTVSVLIILAGLIIVIFMFLQPLERANDISVSIIGKFEPLVFKGAGYYFILNKNDSKIIILDLKQRVISIPNADSIVSIFGLKLWKKRSSLGVSITSYPIEKSSKVEWKQNTVGFSHFESNFKVDFYQK
jgi:hypothetical protein